MDKIKIKFGDTKIVVPYSEKGLNQVIRLLLIEKNDLVKK